MNTRKLGLIALASLGALMVAVVLSSGGRGNPNPRPVAYLGEGGVPEVVLEQNDFSQYVATGRINGKKVEFLVDTGSVDVAMPYRIAERLGLQMTPGHVSKTGNGNVQSWVAWLDSVDIGGLAVDRVRATVLPNMQGDQALLGMAYLKHLEVMLSGGRMTLRPYVSP
ncbi:retropepsin-like aspartic protease family protein [Imhoffiella purpurea]|uniref:retropepsin-like aspartic protease family protein n=1 Tax=Imhoffiella purpurea TaxID=1249627 RepID=UPI001E4B006D|nr:TIGR02281 family clan AA aspartic protease [Imhoffiella purpurea]